MARPAAPPLVPLNKATGPMMANWPSATVPCRSTRDAGKSHAVDGVEQPLQRDVDEGDLPGELLRHGQRRVLRRLFGRLDVLAQVLKLADVDLRFERAGVLVEQIADVGQLILPGLHLGLDRGDFQVAGIHQACDLVVIAPEPRESLLQGRELLGQRQLLRRDLLAQLVELLNALGQFLLGGEGQPAHRFVAARLSGEAADGQEEDAQDDAGRSHSCFHQGFRWSFTGSGTKAGVCLPWRISSAVRTSRATAWDGSHFQPSAVGRPMPASPLALT